MKKIMFNDKYCLTQAVLNGEKTMTRRKFARFRPDARMFDEICNIEGGFDDKWRYIFTLYNENGDIIGDMIPHYNVGEVVAVAQSYKSIANERNEAETTLDLYKIGDNYLTMDEMGAGWNNKMFVRANLLPHHIIITDVKVERLQDISDEDIMREGVWQFYDNKKLFYISKKTGEASTVGFLSAREAFTYLIDKISGKGTWERNPWAVAYGFELVD